MGELIDEIMSTLGSDSIADDVDAREDEADFIALGMIIARHDNPVEWLLAVSVGLALACEYPEACVHDIVREGYARNAGTAVDDDARRRDRSVS